MDFNEEDHPVRAFTKSQVDYLQLDFSSQVVILEDRRDDDQVFPALLGFDFGP